MEQIDQKLTNIKSFYTYLGNILDKGYMNHESTLDKLDNLIKKYNYVESDEEQTDAEMEPESEPEMEFESDNEMESDSDNTNCISSFFHQRHEPDKETIKIQKFLNESNNLSDIYLYKNTSKYIDEMKLYLDNSMLY